MTFITMRCPIKAILLRLGCGTRRNVSKKARKTIVHAFIVVGKRGKIVLGFGEGGKQT